MIAEGGIYTIPAEEYHADCCPEVFEIGHIVENCE